MSSACLLTRIIMTVRCESAEWRATRSMRDERERLDGRDGRRFEVRSSRFPELRTPNFKLRASHFPPVSPVSLESGISDCSSSAHESSGLVHLAIVKR
jgi:hypothetical protein